ncbi:MAG: NUDIX domain-containing protein [Nocardioides sp.]
MSSSLPRRQRVAAYAVILRDDRILLSQVAPHISPEGAWTLPGGGVDHGENPRDALLREIVEETGLDAMVGETARVYSAHLPGVWREGKQVDAHALRIVYDAWVPVDAPSRGSWRSTARPWPPPGTRSATSRPSGSRSPRWCARRWPTTGRTACSAPRRTP